MSLNPNTINVSCHTDACHAKRKGSLSHMQIVKAQISLPICAVVSGLSQSVPVTLYADIVNTDKTD